MASTNFKLFDENKANMLSDQEYAINTQRLNGVQTGVASSQLQNKSMYQASLMAYAIAQIMNQNGKDANDTAAVSAFVANLSGTMLQKVYDIASTAEAKAGISNAKWMSPALVKAAIDVQIRTNQSLLSEEVKTKYGLSEAAIPNDVFDLISRFNSGLGNEYLWRAVKTVYELYQSTTEESTRLSVGQTYTYASDITFDSSTGVITGVNSQTITPESEGSSAWDVLVGKYLFYPYAYDQYPKNTWWKITRRVPRQPELYGYINATKIVSQDTKYVNAAESDAYPPTVDDGYTYTALGKLGAKGQFAIGSYTGTDIYPRTIDIVFPPKAVVITTSLGITNRSGSVYGGVFGIGAPLGSTAAVTANGFTLKGAYINQKNNVYNYLAIG